MKNLCPLLWCLLVGSAWAAPAFSDLDSWQLPPEPVAKPTAPTRPSPRPKPQPAQAQGDELKVEMSGNSSYLSANNTQDPNEIHIFRFSATQLAKKLAGKSRFYVLFNANVVSSYDGIVTGIDGLRYAYVRFGKESGPYRKFLFEGEGDQELLAVADDVPGVLRINALYGVILGPSENDFKKAYPGATVTAVSNQQENKEYHSYQIDGPFFLIFEDGKLVKQFSSADELTAYMQTIGAANSGVSAQKAKEQTELEKMRLRHQPPPPPARPPFKALVEGGTVEDQINLPRVTNPKDYDGAELPPLTPSGPKAGTVLIRDVDGKYMNDK